MAYHVQTLSKMGYLTHLRHGSVEVKKRPKEPKRMRQETSLVIQERVSNEDHLGSSPRDVSSKDFTTHSSKTDLFSKSSPT
jgi:hypothetical protein